MCSFELYEVESPPTDIRTEILEGLRQDPKRISPKYFYNERGSELFAEITRQPEYYPTRTEAEIFATNAADIAAAVGPDRVVVEYGSGNSEKTHLLLSSLLTPSAYIPIDISGDHLLDAAQAIARSFPHVEVLPVSADFEAVFSLPEAKRPGKHLVFFPGSTIGNFEPTHATRFLRKVAERSPGCDLLIGVDLQKSPDVLNAAYNDNAGVTAAFNLNMLMHVNELVDADFEIANFRHVAFYNADVGRIEMHLESLCDQTVTVAGEDITFGSGERLWTESSYKYTPEQFSRLALSSGFTTARAWTDPDGWFSVHLLSHNP